MGKGEDGNVSQLPDTLVRCYESIRTILCGCNEQHFRVLMLPILRLKQIINIVKF